MRGWLLHRLNWVLLGACVAAIIGVQRGSGADAAVEAAARRYAAAITHGDAATALSEIAPANREQWSRFVQEQAGNAYTVKAVSVRSRPLLSGLLRGGSLLPTEETVVLDVNRDDPALFFQANARTPLVRVEGRWYLAQPPLTGDALPQPDY